MIHSPSHHLSSTNPEKLSVDDTTQYSGILVVNRIGNAGTMQTGGPEITNTVGGQRLGQGDSYLYQNPRGLPVRLTDVYVAGTSGDWADTICYPMWVTT